MASPDQSENPLLSNSRRIIRNAGLLLLLAGAAGCGDKPAAPALPTATPLGISEPLGATVTPLPALGSSIGIATATPVESNISEIATEIFITPEEQLAAENVFKESYPKWKNKYIKNNVTSEGHIVPDELRVALEDGTTVSEGIGYGMIAAVHAGDEETFNGLSNYAISHSKDGLMGWKIDAYGKNLDETAATDADEDIAYAYIAASKKWGKGAYEDAAREKIGALRSLCIGPEKELKPGDTWGGSTDPHNPFVNPSYFAPAYYPLFKKYDPGSPDDAEVWDEVAKKSREIIDAIFEKRGPNTLLLPNWSKVDGSSTGSTDFDKDIFSYDASRITWRQALAAQWYAGTEIGIHAATTLKKMDKAFEVLGTNTKDKLNLDGTPAQGEIWTNEVALAVPVPASIVSPEKNYRMRMFNAMNNAGKEGYFGDTLVLLYNLGNSGQMIH